MGCGSTATGARQKATLGERAAEYLFQVKQFRTFISDII
jgi:hypothetical protein